jgi:hypothetical protein
MNYDNNNIIVMLLRHRDIRNVLYEP